MLLHTCHGLVSWYRRWVNKFSKMNVYWWTYNNCLFVSYLPVSQSDVDGYWILNLRNFQIRIGYGYSKIFSDMDRSQKINIRSPLARTFADRPARS